MYTYFWRTAPHPSLTVFDAPDASTACTRRNRSNTPLQALTLLNDQGFYELAQGLATRIIKDGQLNDTDRIELAFHLCLSRAPGPNESNALIRLLREQRGVSAERDAWTAVTRALLNLDEFITRE
jgi:hypothetical protein